MLFLKNMPVWSVSELSLSNSSSDICLFSQSKWGWGCGLGGWGQGVFFFFSRFWLVVCFFNQISTTIVEYDMVRMS